VGEGSFAFPFIEFVERSRLTSERDLFILSRIVGKGKKLSPNKQMLPLLCALCGLCGKKNLRGCDSFSRVIL
jgi:hypothetical protein